MSEIAKALNRPPTYPTKFFGCELGAQTQFDFKNERYIVNGEHDANKLQDLLDGFIRKFVLCPGCDNPETTLTCKKNQITQACKACGYSGLITHKTRLTTFIIKNPPASVEEGAEPSTKKGKGKKGEKNGSSSPTEDKEEVGLAMPEDQTNGFHEEDEQQDEDEWDPEDFDAADTRAQQLTGAMAAFTMNPDLEKPIEERLDMFHNYFLVTFEEKGRGHVKPTEKNASESEEDKEKHGQKLDDIDIDDI